MKTNKTMKTVAAALVAGVMCSSCVGSFTLFNKLAAWNREVTNSKILNEIIFLILSPIHGICYAADILILNSIEFWTGDNPLAGRVGKTQMVTGQDGLNYAVKTLKNGYEVTTPAGEKYFFDYDKKADSWSLRHNGKTRELFRFVGDGTIEANLPGVGATTLTLNEAGLFQARTMAGGGLTWAWAR